MKMKKYLMTGIAALALCAGFTSCSHDLEPMSQDEIDQMEAKKTVETYKKAFEAYVGGKVAANQTWGFSGTFAASRTRNNGIDGAINVNGNMWTECPGVRVNEEVDAIFNYVKNGTEWMTQNSKPFSTTAPDNLNGYFVTQVRSGNNNYADNKYRLKYYNQGTEYIENVGSKMDHLQIAFNQNPSMADLNAATSHDNISGWQHINNFNASANIDWGASDSKEKGNTKVENKGAFDFAYHNSLDQQYHNKWILVDGANISSDPYYADFYYVCFDYESDPANNPSLGNKTYISCEKKMANGSYQGGWNVELDGTYWTAEEVATKLTSLTIDGQSVPMSDIRNIKIERYSQGDKMVKGDNVYTDWIIRITKGAREIERNADLRVMAEDLTLGSTDEDFDFNDIVFDVYFGAANAAKVVVKAAGGTLPLRIARVANPNDDTASDWSEVHDLFANVNPDINCTNKMINTHGTDADQSANVQRQSLDNLTCPEFTLPFAVQSNADAKNIIIQVYKGGQWVEITSEQGEPAAKFAVPHTYGWMKERTSIKSVNESFTEWCTNNSTLIWVGGINE